jgi:cysteine-rich repeat protein
MNQCVACLIGSYYDSTTTACITCSSVIQYCNDCTSNNTCITCDYSLSFIGGACVPNCIYPQCTACSFSISQGIACNSCTLGYGVSPKNQTLCITICGDGILMPTEQCDDGNTVSGDGCSASCVVEEYFNCTNAANSLSQCLLLELSISPLCIVKN